MSGDSKNGSSSTIPPARLSHAVLRTNRFKEMLAWYQTVLGAEVLYQNDFLAFMTYDDEHHRIALVAVPGLVEKPKRSTGLDHLAFFYNSFADWIANFERLKGLGITPHVSVHHGITMSLYYRDPDDNGVELSIDAVDKPNWHAWMRDHLGESGIGSPMDPDDLARKFHAGVPEAELRRVQPAREIDPEMLRRMTD